MNNVIHIKKGLDIPILGAAEHVVNDLAAEGCYATKPTDFVGVYARLLVAEGDSVNAGTPLIEDKNNPAARFVSPVDGTVKSIVRGDKRKLLSVVVEACSDSSKQKKAVSPQSREEVIQAMINNGLWILLKQRPFGIIPKVRQESPNSNITIEHQPKAVFISLLDTSPLPVDIPFMLEGHEEDFQYGIDILHQLTGNVHITMGCDCNLSFSNANIHYIKGLHPAGLVGTQIARISPINKGETVWTVNAQDVSVIGHFFRTGEYRPERVIAICGPVVDKPQYYRVLSGADISEIVQRHCKRPAGRNEGDSQSLRYISGNVLSGTTITDGYISDGCDKVSILPEGDYYDFMGWLRPNFRKFSFSRTFLSGLLNKFNIHNQNLEFDTGRHGSLRPLFVTGEFEKLTPIDIYPMQLIKACIVGDIELMEKLGIYEVEPEDLALCEFADTSKTEIQSIIRNGLELIRKEVWS